MTKRILSICLALAVLLVALPIVPMVWDLGAKADDTVIYRGDVNFKVSSSKVINNFPTTGGTITDRTATDDPGTDANAAYYGFPSSSWTYSVVNGAAKFAYGTSSAGTAYVLMKTLPTATTNMISFHMDATNAAGDKGILNASLNMLFRSSGNHLVAGGTKVYFVADGSTDVETIKVSTATTNGNQRIPLRAGVSGTYYIPAASFGPTTAAVSGYTKTYTESTSDKWINLSDDYVVKGPGWWFSAGVNMDGTRLELGGLSLAENEYILLDDFSWDTVEFIAEDGDVLNSEFLVKNEYPVNTFPHISQQLNATYAYDPGAAINPAMYANASDVTYTYDSAKGAMKVGSTVDATGYFYAYFKNFSVDGVNMLSVHMDLTNMTGDGNGNLYTRLGVAMYNAGHTQVQNAKFYFIPDATAQNPNPAVEVYRTTTASSIWNVRTPLRAGRSGTYYFPEDMFCDPLDAGHSNQEGYNTAWDTFDHDYMTNTDGKGGNGWYFDSGNCGRNYFGLTYFGIKADDYFYIDDIKWVEYAETGSMLQAPTTGTQFAPDSDNAMMESSDIISDTVNTVEVWVNTTAEKEGYILANKFPYSHKTITHDGAEQLWIKMTAEGNPYFVFSDANGHELKWTVTEAVINNGKWNHLAFVKDAEAKKINFYLNGFLKSSLAFEEFGDVNLTQPLTIGHAVSGYTPGGYFDGQIADVRLWSESHTAAQIFAGVTDFENMDKTNLVAQYLLQGDYKESVKGNDLKKYEMRITADNEKYDEYTKEITDAVADGGYSIAFIPDTQCYNEWFPSYFDNPYNWIIDHKDTYNIKAVMSLGDITNKSLDVEWTRAGEQFKRFNEAGIGWTISMGNHDYNNSSPGSRTYDGMMNNFAPSDIPNIEGDGWSYRLGGTFFDGDLSSAYYYLTVGKVEYMLLSLELEPSKSVAQWADQLLKANSDKRVIIATHEYMDSFSGRTRPARDAEGNKLPTYYGELHYGVGLSGEDIWNELIYDNPNVDMILCGHISAPHIQYRSDKNAAGEEVLQILMDPQSWDVSAPPAAVIGLATFSEDGNSVNFTYYSTGLYENGKDQYYAEDDTIPAASEGWYADSNSNELVFDMNAITSDYVDKSLDGNAAGLNAADYELGAVAFPFDKFIVTEGSANGWRNAYYPIYGGSTQGIANWDNGRAALSTNGTVNSFYVKQLPNFVPINGEYVRAVSYTVDASATTVKSSFRINITAPDVRANGFEGRDYNAKATVKNRYILVWDNGTVETIYGGTQRPQLPAGFKGQVILPLDNNFCCWGAYTGNNIMTAEMFASETPANNVSMSFEFGNATSGLTVYLDNISYLTDLGQLTHTVAVNDRDGNLLSIIEVEDGKTVEESGVTLPAIPYRYGYEPIAWDGVTVPLGSNIAIVPVYEKSSEEINVTVSDGCELSYPNGGTTAYYEDRLTVTAPATNGQGETFSYWTANGSIFSYDAKISFLAFDDVQMVAVYGEDVVSEVGVFTNSNATVTETGDTFTMHVMGVVSAPKSANVTEIGIVLAKGEWSASDIANGNAGTTHALKISNAKVNKQFVYNISGIAKGEIRSAVTYAMVDGVMVYGDVSVTATK